MKKTIFSIPKMDCPSEERLIRMALEKSSKITNLSFDLNARELTLFHNDHDQTLLDLLVPLNYGAKLKETLDVTEDQAALDSILQSKTGDESKVLWALLLINGIMFVVEIILGLVAQSTGLIADSLDMFADAAVYGLSLYAVGKAIELKQKAARTSGYLQMLLALFALSEVVRRYFYGSEPVSNLMIGIGFLALFANVSCLLLISKHRDGEVHMKASWIFSTNDVIANMGVILAGFLVKWTGSPIPDLIIGSIIAMIVFSGALRILKVAR